MQKRIEELTKQILATDWKSPEYDKLIIERQNLQNQAAISSKRYTKKPSHTYVPDRVVVL